MVESRKKSSNPNQKSLTGDEKLALCVKNGTDGGAMRLDKRKRQPSIGIITAAPCKS